MNFYKRILLYYIENLLFFACNAHSISIVYIALVYNVHFMSIIYITLAYNTCSSSIISMIRNISCTILSILLRLVLNNSL